MTKTLFMIGAILGQAARVFVVAMVLEVVAGVPVVWSILVITAFAVLWTVIGGIRTVIWTDVIQIVVVVVAAVAAGIFLITQTSGGLAEIFRRASDTGRLRLFDFRFDHLLELTIWTGLFGSTFNTLASHGADQMNTQRLFCCRGPGEARKAILWSSLSQVVVLLLLCLGLGLFCYWEQHTDEFLERTFFGMGQKYAFPVFIAAAMPAGLKGLLVIGLLAAAISSLNSALAALSQTTMPCPNGDAAPTVDTRAEVRRARWHTLAWGALLALVAWYCHSVFLIDIVVGSALRMTTFTYGALLGALLLAFLPHQRDGRGLLMAVPIAVLTAFGTSLHGPWTDWVVVVGVVLVFAGWFYSLFHEVEQLNDIDDQNQYVRRAWYVLLAEFPRTIWVLAGAGLVLYVHFGEFYTASGGAEGDRIAWPWYLPMGTGITVILGYLLSRPRIAKP
jgi:Na+/proline symporter